MNPDTPISRRLVPGLLILLTILTLGMLLIALGVMFNVLPSWSTEISGPGRGPLITPNKILPICSSLLGIVFIFLIFRRYIRKRGAHLFIWGIGLIFFATGSVTESLYGLFGWSDLSFRFWYLFGAVLIAAWMGQGTVHLLARKKVANAFLIVLLIASAYASYKVLTARLDPTLIASGVTDVSTAGGFEASDVLPVTAALLRRTAMDDQGDLIVRKLSPLTRAVSEAAAAYGSDPPDATITLEDSTVNLKGTVVNRTIVFGHPAWLRQQGVDPAPLLASTGRRADPSNQSLLVAINGQPAARLDLRPAIFFSGHVIITPGVRSLTPFFNTFGIITLIGGAIYSAWIFWRKRIMFHRAMGNVLIAAGAILGGGASAFSRFGMLSFLYMAELASLSLVFVGFLVATMSPKQPTESG